MYTYGSSPAERRLKVFSEKSGGTVSALGIEVTQAIQNMNHDVRLIAGKKTVVRVYLKPNALPRNLRVRGEIIVSRGPGTPARFVSSKNVVSLQETDHPSLTDQRGDAELSLNFELPQRGVGDLVVQFNRVIPATRGDDVPISNPELTREVTFVSAPPLRVRVLGMRFTDERVTPAKNFAPDAVHFDYLKSYLTRTFPVPGLEWSQIVVNAGSGIKPPFSSPTPMQFDPIWSAAAGRVIARLQMLRQADVNAGRDPRTHYYGLFADDSGFFQGRASRVPADADPSVVAFGPTGNPSNFAAFDWDKDASFGDWYGAHELAHTFGCRHPGCRATPTAQPSQGRDPASTFPYALGRLSDGAEGCVGFDVGDPDLGEPMRALPHRTTSDFMTYCDNQWVSKHTYDALFDRLIEEDINFAPVIG
ncbi:MAG: hypothetical protein ABJP33_01460 [Pseudoruegeria sp.]